MTHRARPGMGLSIAALAFLPVLVVVATGSCSIAQEAIPDRAGPGETASLTGKSQAGPAETYLAIGDRLKITFFELIDVSSGGNAAPNCADIALPQQRAGPCERAGVDRRRYDAQANQAAGAMEVKLRRPSRISRLSNRVQ